MCCAIEPLAIQMIDADGGGGDEAHPLPARSAASTLHGRANQEQIGVARPLARSISCERREITSPSAPKASATNGMSAIGDDAERHARRYALEPYVMDDMTHRTMPRRWPDAQAPAPDPGDPRSRRSRSCSFARRRAHRQHHAADEVQLCTLSERQDRRLPRRLRLLPAERALRDAVNAEKSLDVDEVLEARQGAQREGADALLHGRGLARGEGRPSLRSRARHGARREGARHGGLRHARHAHRRRRPHASKRPA